MMYCPGRQDGVALVVTLLALAIITAMVVEFSYAVYTGTINLYNWRDSQRLSLMARSGVNVSVRFLSETFAGEEYSYPGSAEFPVENPCEDFDGTVTVRIEDENSKINVNSIVSPNGMRNEAAHNSFKRLLELLKLDAKIADRVLDWIDKDNISELSDSERGAKNSFLYSADELLSIHGISRNDYDKLLPYISALPPQDHLIINVNGAEKPVLMSIQNPSTDEFPITEDLAEKIIAHRNLMPFTDIGDFISLVGTGLSSTSITTKGEFFQIKSGASSGGVKRIIEAVFNMDKGRIEYWKEY